MTDYKSILKSKVLLAACCGTLCATGAGYAWSQAAMTNPPPPTRRDQRMELATKITEPFTVVAVGDMIQVQPFSKYNDPDVKYLVKLMQSSDVAFANNENNIMDEDTYAGPTGGGKNSQGESNLGTKWVADDWANMGIKMVNRANNHGVDGGDQALAEDLRQIERVGITHVGIGRNIDDARAPRYISTPKGLFGLVGVYAEGTGNINGGNTGATVFVTADQLKQLRAMRDAIVARRGEVENPIDVPPPDADNQTQVWGITFKSGAPPPGGEPARNRRANPRQAVTNSLHVVVYNGVTAAEMAQLRAIAGDSGSGDTLAAWGAKFRVTPGPGEYTYDINAKDEHDVLQNIRSGKQLSDFLAVMIHWHQNRFAFQHYSFDHYPADFEVKFAHDAIDQGADLFVGSGVHTLKGVEIYKGKPIFYGVSNYVWQAQLIPVGRGEAGDEPGQPETELVHTASKDPNAIIGRGEDNEFDRAWLEKPDNAEALQVSTHFENGQLAEVRIYPADLGLTPRPGSKYGIPKKPAPAIAQKILQAVVEYSKPFGTKISIENGVGVIRLAGAAK